MTEDSSFELRSTRGENEQVVDRLVSFLKSSYIYPANNRRVVNSAEDLIDCVGRRASAREGVTIHVVGEEIRVDGDAVELPDILNDWLRDAFYGAGLAGVELKADLHREALAEFAERLRNASRDDVRDFSSDWPEELTGLKPLDLMFSGFHQAEGEGNGHRVDTTEILFDGGPLLTDPLAPDSEQARLAERIYSNEEISARLAAIEERWREAIGEVEESARIDIISEIARLLPAEALRDEDRALEFVHGVLDSLESYVPGDDNEAAHIADPGLHEFHGMALNVAKRFFDVQSPVYDHKPAPNLPAGRPGDEVVVDDLGALLDEYGSLPDATGISFPTDDESLSGELLGIYLHRIINDPDGEQRPRLVALAGQLLDDLNEARISVLRSYLEPCLTGDRDAARSCPEWQILTMLREQGRVTILQQAGLLTAELAATLFPEQFGLFLDSLDHSEEGDRDQLRRAVNRIGLQRMREATAELTEEKKILTPSRVRMVLSVDSPEIVPLVGIFAEHSDVATRRDIALLLKKLEPPVPESAALRAVNPTGLLPAGYLRDLCQFDWNEPSEKLRSYSRFLLMKYITDTGDDAAFVENRIYAIRTLAHLPGPETEKFLRELSTRGRLLRISKAARAVRQAAARTLEEIENV